MCVCAGGVWQRECVLVCVTRHKSPQSSELCSLSLQAHHLSLLRVLLKALDLGMSSANSLPTCLPSASSTNLSASLTLTQFLDGSSVLLNGPTFLHLGIQISSFFCHSQDGVGIWFGLFLYTYSIQVVDTPSHSMFFS